MSCGVLRRSWCVPASVTMSVPDSRKSTYQDETTYILLIYPRLSVKTAQSCTLRVHKDATAARVIQNAAVTLGLDMSKPYQLVEVREFGGEEWPLQASDRPVERVLLWPRKVQEIHPQSHGYYFALQLGGPDKQSQANRVPDICCLQYLHPENCNDLCSLPVLTEKNILETLRHRFLKNQIYTYANNILIAVNPFKFLPIYNPKYVELYENHTLGRLDPHIFAIADAAFRAMLSKHLNQCIVISGESGSGKTQSTNFLIHCLTAFSRKGCTSGVERTILGAGPVLEAFGNAKTTYNNNSSRFGKFIQVNFLEGGIVRGATIEKYLLEKCRLVSRKSSERNYHVFYYLLVGASEEEREEFKLLEPEEYHYLKQDNPHLEDEAEIQYEFKRLHQAMEMVGFLPATKKQIFSVLSAILYLGNVTYEAKADEEGLTVGPADVLSTLSELLKVKKELLVEALTKRKAMTANDVLILPYTLSEAITARDSMAKSLYSSLFDWIVLRINHALLNKRDMEDSVPCLSIGVLDIFGFEDFKTNSFEQFCINYANEQLQHYCNQHIFRLEQEEYLSEGITWSTVDYSDNIGCINLISKKPTGLLYLLDEESSFPHATDDTLLEKFKQQHQDNAFFVPTPVMEPAFVILHYAGKVKYQIKDFRAKNTDHMRPGMVALLRSSERGYLRQLIGSDPVAVFRWGILRATIRTLATFKEAGRRWAAQHPDSIRRYSRHSLSEMKRPTSAIGRLMSQRSLIEFSFDRSEENPLEVFEDIFATFESKKELHAKVLCTIKRLGGEVPQKLRLSTISMRKLRQFSQKNRTNRHKQLIPKNLIDSQSLKMIVDLNLHNRDTRSLLHLHKKKKPPSISAQFQTSLVRLLDMLRKAEPFFVRCIRSNAEKREMQFDEDLVLKQLRYTGMLETVRIKRSGYGAKYTFKEFTDEFRVLLPKKASTPQKEIPNLLRRTGIDDSSFQIGKTKVFLKEVDRQKLQETLHREVMRRILILQRWFRACLTRKHYLMKRKAIVTLQRSWRGYNASTRYRAAAVIQMAWRQSHHRAEYLHQRQSLLKMQQLKRPSERRRSTLQGNVSKTETPKISPGIEESKEATAQPPGAITNPLPSIPTQTTSVERKSRDENRRSEDRLGTLNGKEPGQKERAEKENKSPSSAPTRPDSLDLKTGLSSVQSDQDLQSNTAPLQRYPKTSTMREKVEKWKERRSDIGLLERSDYKDLQLQGHKLKSLKSRGISMSLDNLSKLSSSESDSTSPSTSEVRLRSRKRLKHKRRLANPRSILMLPHSEAVDLEYWNFPLPPISPSESIRFRTTEGLDVQLNIDTDGSKVSKRTSVTGPGQHGTPEKTPFLAKFFPKGQKKRLTPQDGNITMAKTLADERGVSDGSPHSYYPNPYITSTLPNRKRRNHSIRISRGTRVQEQCDAFLDRQITDCHELRHLDEYLGNQMNDLQSQTKVLSETEAIFLTATTQFRDTIKSMYSLSNPQINYKGLLQGYKSKVSSLAGQKKRDEVPMVVNLFQSVLDNFIRAEIRKASLDLEPVKPKKKVKRSNDKCPESPLDHSFITYQVNIYQSCDLCNSFIWGMEKACICSSCKMVCHRKCLSKIITYCSKHTSRKLECGKSTVHFGVPVGALTSSETPVPVVMEMMMAHVELQGLYTEGIYRKSGSACKAKELHHLLETDPKREYLENYQIHTVTGLIKSWLRELPDPLMTFSLYNDFLYAVDLPKKSERLQAIYRKVEELPTPNYNTLERLIFHLVRVAKEESHNRMSANSLAIVFAPCVLRCPDNSDPLLSMKDLSRTTLCLETLIIEQSTRYDEKMKEIQQLEHAEALAIKQLTLQRKSTIRGQPRSKADSSPPDSEVEKTLKERIKSLKIEKVNLARRLPEMNDSTSDNETLDSESMASLESPLEHHISGVVSEDQKSKASQGSTPEGAARASRGSEQSTYPSQNRNQLSTTSAGSIQNTSSRTTGNFSDLDIPFIDDDP
ncbi:unconventional myosin-IXb isoform X1 [Astyanax mexicanus]|uniref:Unconventional myosin-IXb isoform X1 n=1 Tax=Astyanax mexicanus TaxID=7994 RepID=A0A8T2LP27_ASTMX|nr:unconventional myosin-IXb isoform X1 [Astyanax mexicanus]